MTVGCSLRCDISRQVCREDSIGYDTGVPIGSGGMGDVFKAWDKELERFVALKFLRYDDPELVERMFREARVQARVDHPGVCKVYEVGEKDGRPFIAMQYVEGPHLDEAARNMTLDQKVLIVKQVAEAVAAAHAVGLIHRDLKPANIKIGETEDGQLRPYVLDFGIAREQEVSGLTVTGQILGTPGYLSPEQARGDMIALDRRTDVFSLGVILYELLGGKTPFAGDSDAEILVNLLKAQPSPLRRLAPDVPRDLETVVMTCLEDRRDRRYQSARELADDLGRFLEGEPVEARPISIMSRVLRRARRNKVAAILVLAMAVVVLGLTAALVGSWIKYTTDLRRERNEALEARREAELKEGEAQEIATFLAGVFRAPAPGQGENVTARELLERSVARLDQELGGQPVERARLINVIANTYASLGLYDHAADYAAKGLDIRMKELGEDHLSVAESLATFAFIRTRGHNWEVAADLYRQALDVRRQHLDEDDPLVTDLKLGLAICLGYLGEVEEAEQLCNEASVALADAFGEDHSKTLFALGVRAVILRQKGDTEAAKSLYIELLEKQRRILGPYDPDVARTLNNLAYLLKTQKNFAEAEQQYWEALEILDRIHERAHPDSIQVRQNLASVLYTQEKYDEVETVLREVVEFRRELHPEGHSRVAIALVNGIGRFLLEREKYAEAEPILREGIEMFDQSLGREYPDVWIARGSLAACLFGLGRTVEAERIANSSLAVLQQFEEFPRNPRYNIRRVADQFEIAGHPEIAARYMALIED